MGNGNEGRNWTDAVQGWPLHERELEGKPRTERRLVFDDTGEGLQSTTGTTNVDNNPDESIIDLVREEEITGMRRRAEEEILLDDDIRPANPTGRKGPGV